MYKPIDIYPVKGICTHWLVGSLAMRFSGNHITINRRLSFFLRKYSCSIRFCYFMYYSGTWFICMFIQYFKSRRINLLYGLYGTFFNVKECTKISTAGKICPFIWQAFTNLITFFNDNIYFNTFIHY